MTLPALLSALTAACLLPFAAQAAATTPAAFSGNQITIGVLTDLTGPYEATTGRGDIVGAQLAIDEFGGQVHGVPIRLLSADHRSSADLSSSKAREWIDQNGADLITAMGNSAVGLAVQALAAEKHVITINTGAQTTALTGAQCTRYGIHYGSDTYSESVGTAAAILASGGRSWYFISADYTFGQSLQEQATKVIAAHGGQVLGSAAVPLNTTDFSSYLLKAQASKAQVIGLANAGTDMLNSIKQANEFRIVQGGQQLATFLMRINDVHALGLPVTQGLQFTTGYYWDRNAASRAFAARFFAVQHAMPSMNQAATYSAVRSYLKAVDAVGTDDADAVRAELGKMKIDDAFTHGHIRADGLFVHPMYLVQVKTPAESLGEWDLLTVKRTIPASRAFMSLEQGGCPLVAKS